MIRLYHGGKSTNRFFLAEFMFKLALLLLVWSWLPAIIFATCLLVGSGQ